MLEPKFVFNYCRGVVSPSILLKMLGIRHAYIDTPAICSVRAIHL
jgi:hypothetical protein